MTVQSERAFQKQPHIFKNPKVKAKSARPGKGGRRWYKDVGLGFRTPKTAIEGSYIGTCDWNWENVECKRRDSTAGSLWIVRRALGAGRWVLRVVEKKGANTTRRKCQRDPEC